MNHEVLGNIQWPEISQEIKVNRFQSNEVVLISLCIFPKENFYTSHEVPGFSKFDLLNNRKKLATFHMEMNSQQVQKLILSRKHAHGSVLMTIEPR